MGSADDSSTEEGWRDGCAGATLARMRILIIEDEVAIADFVQRGLQAEGYAVEVALDGLDGERRACVGACDLVILDRMLPGRDGLEVLAAIRADRPGLPVLMLTARGEVTDRVAGLDAGATDYLVKPFAFDELAARVRAHLRQSGTGELTRLSCGDIELDLLGRTVRRSGREVALPAREFDLLAYFLRHHGRALSRAEILSAVWGIEHDPATNLVDVYVGYLRRKLEQPGLPAPITTVRSMGYRLEDRA